MAMNPKRWAETQGISYRTALRWWDKGKLPVPAHTGTDTAWLTAFVVVLLACGAGIYVANRPKH